MVHLVLLSGGSGSRLWPLSNDSRSKQFLKVLRDEQGTPVSMVQRVFSQIKKVPIDKTITIATSESQKTSIENQIQGEFSLVLEPERRDTAPAIMLSCMNLYLEQNALPEDTVIVMPIDTYADQAYYDHIIDLDFEVQKEKSELVLLGVKPTYPSAKYGYIIPQDSEQGSAVSVKEFKEKPDEATAKEFIAQGGLWNCGVFAFKLKYLLSVTKKYLDFETFNEYLSSYTRFPKNSFDYEVVEKAVNISVVPYEGEWKDLGTWNTLTEEMKEPYSGRVVVDNSTCENVHVINETGFPMVVAGLSDAVVIATPDGILAAAKGVTANIKTQVQKAASSRPMYEKRRWGEYRVIDSSVFPDGAKALTKELIIKQGKQLSYQKHAQRSEVWTIISGKGEIVLDGIAQEIKAGSVVQIKAGQLHAARALEEMHVIEVQTGEVLIEEDIERFGYFW